MLKSEQNRKKGMNKAWICTKHMYTEYIKGKVFYMESKSEDRSSRAQKQIAKDNRSYPGDVSTRSRAHR